MWERNSVGALLMSEKTSALDVLVGLFAGGVAVGWAVGVGVEAGAGGVGLAVGCWAVSLLSRRYWIVNSVAAFEFCSAAA